MTTPKPNAARFWPKVNFDAPGGCWLWTGAKTSAGYGDLKTVRGRSLAHRWAFEELRGAIPAGLQIDHLCRVRACVNPWHMEPVTARTNLLRGTGASARNVRKTGCPSGHPYSQENTYITPGGGRHCRACKQIRDATRDRRRQ